MSSQIYIRIGSTVFSQFYLDDIRANDEQGTLDGYAEAMAHNINSACRDQGVSESVIEHAGFTAEAILSACKHVLKYPDQVQYVESP